MEAEVLKENQEEREFRIESTRRSWEDSDWFRRWLELIRKDAGQPAHG